MTAADPWFLGILIAVSIISFWIQAIITSDRFVPALNVICTHFHIPDDVAGATLMSAGASGPELVVVFISICFTHSSLGIGTVIGSEVFNQLIITAGSVLASKNQQLTLEPRIIFRELFFYSLSVLILCAVVEYRKEGDNQSVRITIIDGLLLLGTYIFYVVVCAKFEDILRFMNLSRKDDRDISYTEDINDQRILEIASNQHKKSPQRRDSQISVPDMPYIRSMSSGDSKYMNKNMRSGKGNDMYVIEENGSHNLFMAKLYCLHDQSNVTTDELNTYFHSAGDDNSNDQSIENDSNCFGGIRLQHSEQKCDLNEIEYNTDEHSFSCFLWQKSAFYSKARINIHAWQLRWFTFYIDKIISVPDRSDPLSKSLVYPPFDVLDIDESRRLISIQTDGTRPNYVFLASSESVLEIVVKQMLQIKMQPKEALENEFKSQISAKYGNFHEPITDAMIIAAAFRAEANPPLIAWPSNGSIISTSSHVVLFPFKLLIHLTIPDVRCVPISKGGPSLQTALFSIFISILWLIPWTYIMVLCLETLGHAWHINDAIMGLTASAAGTAIPNYIASHVTATQGLSNMAISNAIGSNTFNILICLGLPWVILTSVQGSYIEKWDSNIKLSMILMISVHIIFSLTLIYSGFRLYRMTAFFFLGVYVMFILSAISFSTAV